MCIWFTCRPLHIAVARGTVAAVDSIISIMLSLGVSLDYCNKLQQVSVSVARHIALYLNLIIIV